MPFLPPNKYADDTILENKFNLTEENPTAIKKINSSISGFYKDNNTMQKLIK